MSNIEYNEYILICVKVSSATKIIPLLPQKDIPTIHVPYRENVGNELNDIRRAIASKSRQNGAKILIFEFETLGINNP